MTTATIPTAAPATAIPATLVLVDREKMAIFLGMDPQATNTEIRQYFRSKMMIDSGMSSSWGFGWETMLAPSGAKMEFDNSIGPARYRYWIPAPALG